ncbi:MAG TPA: metal/formaldehyde-sensitive transcriptional repressor [Tepidisphaeraceae bacterium]|jgi:DNA-binding FrmR family transcriptional regulator|nr:metal/formaldehyde-sensitive transcriptional repressor [Tepidisphaeraceae bacterium]
MSHTVRDKQKLLNRIRRIRGQVEAIENALEEEQECSAVLQLIAAARGAMAGLMSEVIEDHIRDHLVDAERRPTQAQLAAAEELINVLKSYLK